MSGDTKKRVRTKGLGRASFLSQIALIQEKLDAGIPNVVIYNEISADLGISLSQFNRYVAKYLRKKGETDAAQTQSSSGKNATTRTAGSTGSAPSPAQKQNQQGRVGKIFNHDPNSANRDDLV